MEDAKVKREMRRRKILENSEKRMQRITRCQLEEDNLDENGGDSVTMNPPNFIDRSEHGDEHLQDSINLSFNDYALANRDDHENTFSKFSACIPEDSRFKFWKKLGFKLIILAIIVRVTHTFKIGYLFGQTIVIPFALFMMTQLGSCQFDQSVVGISGPILFFMGMSPSKIKNLLICYNVVTSILVYFAIYFSTFVIAHFVCVTVFEL